MGGHFGRGGHYGSRHAFVEPDCYERMINIIVSINKDRKKNWACLCEAQIYIITYISSDRLNLTEKKRTL